MSTGNAKQVKIERGSIIHLSSPTKPDAGLAQFLAEQLADFPELYEAHLPLCFVPSTMSTPAPVLVLVMDQAASASGVFKQQISARLSRYLAADAHLDIWFLTPRDPLMEGVRRADCRILERAESGEAMIRRPWSLRNRLRRRLASIWPGV